MTCKQCTHYEACHRKDREIPSDTCRTFQDKSCFIKLPFKIGAKVFHLDKVQNIVRELEIICIEIAYNGIKFDAYGEEFTTTRFAENKIGKTIFRTREEAEKALEERRGI